MDVVDQMKRLGGVTDRATLIRCTSRSAVDRALRRGDIVRDGHGRYALPAAEAALRAANRLSGVVSHRSAALHWGWAVKTVPELPDVMVPKSRKVPVERRQEVSLHRGTPAPDQVQNGVTSRTCTLVDCMRTLPFDEALAIADSALRSGDIGKQELIALADGVTGAGAARCRRVAAEANAKAANPFESVLRAIAVDVPGLRFEPQVVIRHGRFAVRPDLVDLEHGVVCEADSFEWHGNRSALRRDCRRYTGLVVRGWWVLRFTWEDVMFRPDYVRACLTFMAQRVGRRTKAARRRAQAA